MKKFVIRLFGVVVICIAFIQIWILVCLLWWSKYPVETTMFMRIDAFQSGKKITHDWKDNTSLSPYFKKAVIASEDAKFVQHHGFDWDGVQYALAKNEKTGEIVAGGSTISQQLAKNLFLFNERSFLRKAQEALITVMLERLWTKERILEVYVNSVELGNQLYGVEAASWYYFNKPNQKLTPQEAMFLASLLPNPKYYQHHQNDKKLKRRQQFIAKYFSSIQLPS